MAAPHDRFLIAEPPGGPRITLAGREFHHMTRVKRHRVGDPVTLFTRDGKQWVATIAEVGRDRVELSIEGPLDPTRGHSGPRLIIAFSPPKGARGDALIEKCTELGADEFVPMICERTVARLDAGSNKLERWRRIAVEAAEQCQRGDVPVVQYPAPLADVIARMEDADARWIAALTNDARSLASAAASAQWGDGSTAFCLIGPEGGFTDDELAAACEAGCIPVSLGANVLRVETAAMAACAVLRSNTRVKSPHRT